MFDKKILITIPPYGAPKIEAEGFNGIGCAEATAAFEQALSGGAIENRTYKPEWSNPETGTEQEQEGLSW